MAAAPQSGARAQDGDQRNGGSQFQHDRQTVARPHLVSDSSCSNQFAARRRLFSIASSCLDPDVASTFPQAMAARCLLSLALLVPLPQAFAQVPSERSVASVLADAMVCRAVLAKLRAARHLDATHIEVAVRSGIVQLAGDVSTWPWRERAARVALAVAGVRGVVNRVRVVPVRRRDKDLRRDVREALRDEPSLEPFRIVATVARGVVDLRGQITTWEQQRLAERVVMSVPGVRYCQNLLTSRGARTARHVAGDIRSRLAWDPLVENDPVQVTARAGRVELIGTTGSDGERARVIALAWVESVSSVDAHGLEIDEVNRPDPNVRARRPTDLEISDAIRDLLTFWPSIIASNAKVAVTGGVVLLSGTVRTPAEKRAIEYVAQSAAGVARVSSTLGGSWLRSPPQPSRRRNTSPRRR